MMPPRPPPWRAGRILATRWSRNSSCPSLIAGRPGPNRPFEPQVLVLRSDSGLRALPLHAVGRVGQAVVDGLAGVLVVRQRVAEGDRVDGVALDHHVGLADRVGLVVELLPGQHHLGLVVALLDVLLGQRQHAAGARGRVVEVPHDARLVQHLVIGRQQQIDDQGHGVARGEVLTSRLVRRLGELADELLEDRTPDLGSFRLVAHAGAPCPPEVKRRLVEAFPDGSTWEFYGSTEGQFTACRSEEWEQRPGTVGRARPGRELIVDDDGTIWCVVPPHARFEYFRHPEKTAGAWRSLPDGQSAFTVGDLGRLDDDGYLFLDGRREDLVISGGVNVYPVEVENALREHPGVEDVAVYGVPDDEWGQRVCAAVVGTASEQELTAYARERLSPAKRPKQWRFLPELPHTATGKVRRRELS